MKLLGNCQKGLLIILSAPAGTGKTTLISMLKEEFPSVIAPSISYTSRVPRRNEIDGQHYHFISKEEFEKKISQGEFLEYVHLYGEYYGTSKQWVEKQLQTGKHVFLVIDTQGAKQLKGKVPAIFIFVKPPSLEELRKRLHKRQTETPEKIEQRLSWATKEIAASPFYDYLIVNERLPVAYQVLRSILIAEEHRQKNVPLGPNI